MSVRIEISALPQDKRFEITYKDGWDGLHTHGPCRMKKGVLMHVGLDYKLTPVRTDIEIIAYNILPEVQDGTPF